MSSSFVSKQILRLMTLTAVCSLLAGGAFAADPPLTEEISKKRLEIQQKLQEPISFDFVETPLSDVIEFFNKSHQIEILMNESSLEDIGLSGDEAVTLNLSDVTLHAGLRQILYPLGLTYVLKEDALIITPVQQAKQELNRAVYPVRDLIQFNERGEDAGDQAEDLKQLIMSSIEPNSWDSVGGPASLDIISGVLTISQTGQALSEVEKLLSALRKLPQVQEPWDSSQPGVIPVMEASPGSKRIKQALNKEVSLEFIETPLVDLVAFLRDMTDIPIVLDEKAMSNEGIDRSRPVTFKAKTLTLRSALRLMLKRMSLEFMEQDGILVLTNYERTESNPVCVVYAVKDLLLLPEDPGHEEIEQELSKLSQMIRSMVRPETWSDVGGFAALESFDQRAALVISTKSEIHEMVETLLARFRKVKAQQDARLKPVLPDLDKVEVVIYELSYAEPKVNAKSGLPETTPPQHIDTEKLVKLVPTLLGAEVWGEEESVMIEALADRLVVKHSRRVQRKVRELLDQLGVGVVVHEPGSGPMQGFGLNSGSFGSSGGGGIFNLKDEIPLR